MDVLEEVKAAALEGFGGLFKGYAVHDDTCEDHGAYPGSCTCGLSRLLKEIGDDRQ